MEINPMGLPKKDWPQIPGYELKEQIGTGGSAVVFKAIKTSLNRTLKVKYFMPSPSVENYAKALARFEQEAAIISKLDHPSIETYYDFIKLNNVSHCIVTIYFDGQSVKDRLKEKGVYTYKEAIKVLIEVCKCIKYCHGHDIIHRDLKPSHIIVNSEGNIKVIDFGIAYDFEQKIRAYSTSSHIGTIPYMCREQREDPTHRDKRNDIFSTGVIFYEMLMGHAPDIDFTPVSDAVISVDPRVDEVIENCLKRESKRYQSIDLLLEALQSFEFLEQRRKNLLEEKQKKYDAWARKMAEQKTYAQIHKKVINKKIASQKKKDNKIWLTAFSEHISDLSQLVDALNGTGKYNLSYNWSEIKERPPAQKGSTGPVIGQISLSENEIMRIRTCFVDPGTYIGNYIQPCIIWETVHSKRSHNVKQELIFLINTDGEIKLYSRLLVKGRHKPIKIQDVYQSFFENKLQYDTTIDERTTQNILDSLTTNNYALRRDQGYEIIEEMIQKQLSLPDKIGEKLFMLFSRETNSDAERSYCINLLRKANYTKNAYQIMDYWESRHMQISDALSEQIAKFFASTDDLISLILARLEDSEPINDITIRNFFDVVHRYVESNSISTEQENRILTQLKKYEDKSNIWAMLSAINKKITGKPLRAGKEVSDG